MFSSSHLHETSIRIDLAVWELESLTGKVDNTTTTLKEKLPENVYRYIKDAMETWRGNGARSNA